MNCEFCNVKKATYRCPNCGTSVCDKHLENRIGAKLGGALFLLIPGIPAGVWAADYFGIHEQWAPVALGVFFAGGASELLNGKGCMKCQKNLKKL